MKLAEKKGAVDPAVILEAHFSLAEASAKIGNKEKAIFHYKKCIELTSDNASVQKELKASLEKLEKEVK